MTITPEQRKAIQNPLWHHPEFPINSAFVSKSLGEFTVLEHGYLSVKVRYFGRTEWIDTKHLGKLLQSGHVTRKEC
jgi:hypothetical protein